MSAQQELLDFCANLSEDRVAKIVDRILNLSEEQLDQLIALYAQQEQTGQARRSA